MDSDKSATAADIVLKYFFLLIGVKRLIVGIRKNKHIKFADFLFGKDGRIISGLKGPAIIGANLFQSGLTNWCLMDKILKKAGVPEA